MGDQIKPSELKSLTEKAIDELLKTRKIHFQHMEQEQPYSAERVHLKSRIQDNSRCVQILRDKWRFINEKYPDDYHAVNFSEFNELWEKRKKLRYDKRNRIRAAYK
jgi:hypothetical protein